MTADALDGYVNGDLNCESKLLVVELFVVVNYSHHWLLNLVWLGPVNQRLKLALLVAWSLQMVSGCRLHVPVG